MNVAYAMRLVLPCTAAAIVVGCNFFEASSKPTPAPAMLGVDDPATLRLGPVVSLAHPPPPISGGTLAIARDGVTAVAADPDRDLVYVVDLGARTLSRTITLSEGDEPGRVAIDDAGRAHVALRGAGALLSIDLATGATMRRTACVAPRGVAIGLAGTVLVACADGQIARFSSAGGEALSRTFVEHDLRDVSVRPDGTVLVSKFRSASLLMLSPELKMTRRWDAPGVNLAWRTIDQTAPSGKRTTVRIAQRPQPPNPLGPAYYSPPDDCELVPTHVDVLDDFGGGDSTIGRGSAYELHAVLPVDGVVDEQSVILLSAGNGHSPGAPQLVVLARSAPKASGSAGGLSPVGNCAITDEPSSVSTLTTPGQPTAIAIDSASELIVQSREPAALYVFGPERVRVMHTIALSDVSREDTGHAIFHSNSGRNVTCASCHAEGGDDSMTWNFADLGARRTPSLRGTIQGTAPYHWDGSQKDMTDIMNHVFRDRMSGPQLDQSQIDAAARWVSAIPAPAPMSGASEASARGAAVFAAHGCDGCHSGAKRTNNLTVDVGTGGSFQVPSLVGVAWRAPYLHDGRYRTLNDRFAEDTGPHAGMTTEEISDLVAFLETL
jgi:hypothetical protein